MARANRFKGKSRFLFKLRSLKDETRLEIEKATGLNARDVANLARSFAPVADGDLKASIKAEARGEGRAILWRVIAGDETAFYARMVEFGTAPGVRGEVAVNPQGRRRVVGRNHVGTSARPYFFPAYRALRRRLKRRLSAAFTRAKRKALAK